jgi:nucleoside-diphosphate kinase
MERTLILVKPDAYARNLTGEIIARFERKGLRLAALQQMTVSRELAARHYAEHEGKGFYGELVDFITSGPLVAMVLEGESAITAARQMIGATNPLQADTGSIRGDYAVSVGQNMVHGSDAPESAAREVGPLAVHADDRRGARPRVGLAPAPRDPRPDRRAVHRPRHRRR